MPMYETALSLQPKAFAAGNMRARGMLSEIAMDALGAALGQSAAATPSVSWTGVLTMRMRLDSSDDMSPDRLGAVLEGVRTAVGRTGERFEGEIGPFVATPEVEHSGSHRR